MDLRRIPIYLLRVFLIFPLIYSVYNHNFTLSFVALTAWAISFLPIFINRNYKVNIPLAIELLICLLLYLNIFEYTFNITTAFYPYSIILHFLGFAMIALLAFVIVYSLNLTKYVNLSPGMIGFFTIIFAVAIGAIWELLEFYSDLTLGTHLQGDGINPLTDTMIDMTWDSIAGIIIAILGTTTHILTNKKLIKPFKKLFKELGFARLK